MLKLRLAAGVIAFLTGIVLAVIAIVDARYWGAISLLAAGATLAATLVLWEVRTDPRYWLILLFAVATTCFSVADAFVSSHAVNSDELEAQRDFVQALIEEKAGSPRLNSGEKRLAEKAFNVCVLQEIQDQQDLAVGAYKALYFGPTLTLADGVNSALPDKRPVRCLDYYRTLRKTNPLFFSDLEKKHPWLLAAPSN